MAWHFRMEMLLAATVTGPWEFEFFEEITTIRENWIFTLTSLLGNVLQEMSSCHQIGFPDRRRGYQLVTILRRLLFTFLFHIYMCFIDIFLSWSSFTRATLLLARFWNMAQSQGPYWKSSSSNERQPFLIFWHSRS